MSTQVDRVINLLKILQHFLPVSLILSRTQLQFSGQLLSIPEVENNNYTDTMGPAPPPRPTLPRYSWPGNAESSTPWKDYDLSGFPFDMSKAFSEVQRICPNPPPDWQNRINSSGLYPGWNFPRPRDGFTGYHKIDYYNSIGQHARDHLGNRGESLMRRGGFADLNWARRCWKINQHIHEWNIWRRYGSRLPRKPPVPPAQIDGGYSDLREHQK